MKIFNSIQINISNERCENCLHFQNDPSFIEETYPGLKIMSSGFASVRDKDGFCNYKQVYLSARDCCRHFVRHIPESDSV